MKFELRSKFQPTGDQPSAIDKLDGNLRAGVKNQVLLGVTGSGKTFTMAHVIAKQERPALVMAPNKTLAAQLYSELRELFPENNVCYFVSYYDYYQPEAYVPSTNTYIEKDAAINDEIDKLRHSATRALLEDRDTIVVATVSCIYGIGAPEEYFKLMLFVECGLKIGRQALLKRLVEMRYTRVDVEFVRGTFRVTGEVVDIFPSDQDSTAIRLVFFGDEIEEIREIDSITGSTLKKIERATVYPTTHYVTSRENSKTALIKIRQELQGRVRELVAQDKRLEAERLEQRTLYDLELLEEIGFCSGIENYSRHLSGREAGEPSTTLIDYFPKDFLTFIDESHVTIPQLQGMYRGDRSRKQNLVDFGFRLPSALDNRPLRADEFWSRVGQTVFVSATPGDYELQEGGKFRVEQLIRPTGLLDPVVEIRPAANQVDDLLGEIQNEVKKDSRVLVTTLTKRMAEDLSTYLRELGIKSRYLHSDIDTIERVEILRGLRKKDFDVLIGINLLREGLDLPEVSLVAILDGDKEGFLRSKRSLIQTIGRAARNERGRALIYADNMTDSIKAAIDETDRRRKVQDAYNKKHGIVPTGIKRDIPGALIDAPELDEEDLMLGDKFVKIPETRMEQQRLIESLRRDMLTHASKREFEQAAEIRDILIKIQERILK